MIPMYGFGDILDYCSIKRWFEIIRQKQKSGEISGHALIFLNFDMDYENWIGLKLPKFLNWMPNSRGLMEFAEAVDQYDYAEFTNLLEIIPKLVVEAKRILFFRYESAESLVFLKKLLISDLEFLTKPSEIRVSDIHFNHLALCPIVQNFVLLNF
ncbi:unnamed protein product [marine sediment metagenome]|uniref:Uncharacterized protein n=1 Tax=marine sediment metagenome TaxID=412755 RepID=X1RWV9_9ZZZZ